MKMQPHPSPASHDAFLRPEDLHAMQRHLRGVRAVEVRQLGGSPEAGAEVVAHLEAEGFDVAYRALERMTPPPSCRMVFRYRGANAELTITPDLPH